MSLTNDPRDPRLKQTRPDGQQDTYLVLPAEARERGFVRPVRREYRHVGARPKYHTRPLTEEEAVRYAAFGYVVFEGYPEEADKLGRYWTKKQLESGCGSVTTMARELAETYAAKPDYYGATFCATCGAHFPVGEHGEFVWIEEDGRDGARVGT